MFVPSFARKKAPRRGFSLVEVLTAMFVIVVGLSGVTATLWWGTRQTDNGKVITEASNIARICMETLIIQGRFKQSVNVNDAANVRNPVSAPPLAAADFTTVGTTVAGDDRNIASMTDRFTRNISMQPLSNNTTDYDYPLCRATVRIYWKDKENRERSVTHETITPWRDPPAGAGGSGGTP